MMRFISAHLIIAFISYDIAWAYSFEPEQKSDKLAVEVVSQATMMTDSGQILQNDVRSNALLCGVVLAVARFLMGTDASYSDSTARKNLERVESFILDQAANSEYPMDRVLPIMKLQKISIDENNNIIIPFRPNAKDTDRESYFLVSAKGRSRGDRTDGYVIPLNDDHFVITVLPDGYTKPHASMSVPKPAELSPPNEPVPAAVKSDNKEDGILISAIVYALKTLHVLVTVVALIFIIPLTSLGAQPRPVWGPNRSDAVIAKETTDKEHDLKPVDEPGIFRMPVSDDDIRAVIDRPVPPGWRDPYSGPIQDPPKLQPAPGKYEPVRKSVVWPSDLKPKKPYVPKTTEADVNKDREQNNASGWEPRSLGHLEPPPLRDDDATSAPSLLATVDRMTFETAYRVENRPAKGGSISKAAATPEPDPDTHNGRLKLAGNKFALPADRAAAIAGLSDGFYLITNDDGSIQRTLEAIAADDDDDASVRKAASEALLDIQDPWNRRISWWLWRDPTIKVLWLSALVFILSGAIRKLTLMRLRDKSAAAAATGAVPDEPRDVIPGTDQAGLNTADDHPGNKYASQLKGYINNRIAMTLEAGNRIMQATGLAPRGGELRRDKKTLGAALVYSLGSLLDAVNASIGDAIPEDILDDLALIENNIGQIDADTMIAAAINLAQGRDQQKEPLTIVIETSWIPGYNDSSSPQRSAITPLIKAIEDLPATLRALHLGNIKVVVKNSEEELCLWADEGISLEKDCSNIVVFGSMNAVGAIAERAGKMVEAARPFLSGIDASALTPDSKGSGEEFAVNLLRMLAVTFEIASGKKAPHNIPLGITVMNKRWIILIPPAEPVDLLSLRSAYAALVKTLAAA
ncbi:MAG: hypothetical protein HQL30_09270 [Candidatus Omnitrophica bacterium]|nr:hypothetical protein [Candidatus Omnitrophota bacterium]